MKKTILILAFLASTYLVAQPEDGHISKLLNKVAQGDLQFVQREIPNLVAAYPNDPGVKLILAVVIDDAFKAMEFYNEILNDHPASIWADDAYWRVVQFYAILGDTTQARLELNNFRQKYPTSEYIVPASHVVKSAVGLARIDKKRVINLGNVFRNRPSITATHKKKENIKSLIADNKTSQQEAKLSKTEMPESKEYLKTHIEPPVLANASPEPIPTTIIGKDSNFVDNKIKESKEKAKEKALEKKAEVKDVPLSAAQILEEKMAQNKKDLEDFKKRKKAQYDKKHLDELNKKKDVENSKVYYGLQVGLFNTKEAAEAEMKKFLQQRMRTEVRTKTIDDEDKYAVVIGNYTSRASAESAKYYVNQQCNCNPIILQK